MEKEYLRKSIKINGETLAQGVFSDKFIRWIKSNWHNMEQIYGNTLTDFIVPRQDPKNYIDKYLPIFEQKLNVIQNNIDVDYDDEDIFIDKLSNTTIKGSLLFYISGSLIGTTFNLNLDFTEEQFIVSSISYQFTDSSFDSNRSDISLFPIESTPLGDIVPLQPLEVIDSNHTYSIDIIPTIEFDAEEDTVTFKVLLQNTNGTTDIHMSKLQQTYKISSYAQDDIIEHYTEPIIET